MYYLNGKWSFGRITIGAIICITVLIAGLYVVWWTVNKLLIEPIELDNRN